MYRNCFLSFNFLCSSITEINNLKGNPKIDYGVGEYWLMDHCWYVLYCYGSLGPVVDTETSNSPIAPVNRPIKQ